MATISRNGIKAEGKAKLLDSGQETAATYRR